jgi:hypothetical protein
VREVAFVEKREYEGYIVQVGDKYYSGYDLEYGEAYFDEDLDAAMVIRSTGFTERHTIEEYAEDLRDDADPNDVDKTQPVRIHKCIETITILG